MNSIIFKPRNAILILLLFSLGLYYHTINAESLSLDDKGMIANYNNKTYSIKQFFFSGRKEHYYRPVVLSSFLIDYYIWMDHESGFHLTNIIFHTANTILVYILSLRLGQNSTTIPPPFNPIHLKEGKGVIAFFSAIFFAVHPINTEAVNFISARTDILATFFVLISFLLFLYYKKSAIIYLFLSALAYFLAILSKEVALSLPLIILSYVFFRERNEVWRRIRSVFWVLTVFTFLTMLYFYLRSVGLSKGDIGMSRTLVKIDAVSSGMLFDFISSVGFYFKKLIYPFPLNFAIVEINKELYFIIGTVCLAFLLSIVLIRLYLIMAKREKYYFWQSEVSTLSVFLLWSILLSLLPSIPISLAPIAWTPYAERYLYLPSVFFCILLSYQLSTVSLHSSDLKPIRLLVMATILLLFSFAAYKRNTLWLSNLTFWEDTVKKSPNIGKVRNEYGVALIIGGEEEKAKEQFTKAIELGHKSNPYFNLGRIALRNSNMTLAEDYFNKGLQIAQDIEAYRTLGYIYEKKAGVSTHGIGASNEDHLYLLKAVKSYEKVYQMDRDDEILALKLAVLYRRVNRYEDARAILQKVINDNPDSYIEKSAKKIMDKVNAESKN